MMFTFLFFRSSRRLQLCHLQFGNLVGDAVVKYWNIDKTILLLLVVTSLDALRSNLGQHLRPRCFLSLSILEKAKQNWCLSHCHSTHWHIKSRLDDCLKQILASSQWFLNMSPPPESLISIPKVTYKTPITLNHWQHFRSLPPVLKRDGKGFFQHHSADFQDVLNTNKSKIQTWTTWSWTSNQS